MHVYDERSISMIAKLLNKSKVDTFSKWVDMQIQMKTQASSPEANDLAPRWTQMQDETIVSSYARGLSWSKIGALLPNKTPQQCRERYHLHLDPEVHRVKWTPSEDQMILNL